MAKQSSTQSFFSIVVPVAALIVTTTLIFQQTKLNSQARTPKKSTFTYSLEEGYHALSMPLDTDLHLQDVCDEFSLETLSYWQNDEEPRGPIEYRCQDPILSQTPANKQLLTNTSILIDLAESHEWTISGTKGSYSYDTPVAGVYLYGFSDNRDLYANSICKMLNTPALKVQEVYTISGQSWETAHDCDDPSEQNFALEKGTAYGIWVTDGATSVSPRNSLNKAL